MGRYLFFGIFHLLISCRLLFLGLCGLSCALGLGLRLNFGCRWWRMCRRRSFRWLCSATSWLGSGRILRLVLAVRIMVLVSWGRVVYLNAGKGTSIEQLNNGYQSITILHPPKDLLIINYHLANLINCLVDHLQSYLLFNPNYI